MSPRPRDLRVRILGPTWIQTIGLWRVQLLRPGKSTKSRYVREKEEADRIAALDPAAFLKTMPEERYKKRRHRSKRVYFIQAGQDGPIKIGKANDVMRRLGGLQAASWVELRLLIATDEVSERDMHQRFAHLRIRGEWFRPEPELLSLIGSIPRLRVRL